MSNEKTLATAKHGGCVQLGDWLLPCPFCGSPAERIDFGPGAGDNEGGSCVACTRCQASGPVEFGCKENFISDWNRRALSAQPSPGGQGDARLLADVDERIATAKALGYEDDIGVGIGLLQCVRAALAASQPVGEITDAEIDARLNALYREMVDSGQHNGGMSGVAWDRAVFRMASKQPAQAVDLGQQQDAARWRAIAPHLSVEWDEDEMLKRWTWIDFKGDALSVPTRTRESYASVDEAMDAVIDSQAVGNG